MVMKWLLTGIAVFATFILAYLSVIFVPEGHVDVITRAGKAVRQLDPGLQFKILSLRAKFESIFDNDAQRKN